MVDRWVNARPSQLALNLGQQRVQMVLYRSNHLALSYRDSSVRPVHHLGVNDRRDHSQTLSARTTLRQYEVLGGALSEQSHAGSDRALCFSRCTTGSNEIEWRFIVATTHQGLIVTLSAT